MRAHTPTPISHLTVALRSLAVAIFALVLGGHRVLAGPLNPPAGAIASTGKTLTEVEPRTAISEVNTPGDADSLYKITQPGSYYLTGNIAGVTGKHGIEIAASGVTLDLRGFDLAGVLGSLSGVTVSLEGAAAVTVRNGSARSWGSAGIDLSANGVFGARIENITAADNRGAGIMAGPGAVIQHCAAVRNQLQGFRLFAGCRVSGCTAAYNADGFNASGSLSAVDCNAYDNTATGFISTAGSSFRTCIANSNHTGFSLTDACSVVDCTVYNNATDGIRIASHCQVRSNTCHNNGTSGAGSTIHATGTNNRIEDNNVSTTPRGFFIEASGNFIARNTVSEAGTAWTVAPNNKCLVVVGVNSPSIDGPSGGVSPGSTDPNANFTY